MRCEVAHERIVTAAYSELPDGQAEELEQHVEGCAECRGDREEVLALRLLAGALPMVEPDANLMARARLRLDEALDALPPKPWYERWMERMRNGLANLEAAPVAALVVLAVGAGAGGWGGYRLAQRQTAPAAAAAPASAVDSAQAQPADSSDFANVASVSAITRRPDSEIVNVTYSQLVPRQVTGSLDDPAIRQLLMMGAENQTSARVRGDSVGLLASECKKGHSCRPYGIRDALIVALRNDPNPQVREQALAGLKPYVSDDVRVRDAVLEALMDDDDPRIRSSSISMLAPVEADTSVRQVLNSVSTTDENPHIRFVSRQILDQVPEIQ